jgi:molybdate/tungstate transport system substrate-binding protein
MEHPSRRSVLGFIGATGCLSLAGCLGGDSVSVLAAGSLAAVLEDGIASEFEDASGVAMHGEYLGSNALLRLVESEQKRPDAVVSADVQLLRERLYPAHASWDVVFCSNELGIAYDPSSALGDRLAAGDAWYDVLVDADDGMVAISDPDLDPLGYRAMHLFQLAERRHGLSNFAEQMADVVAIEPEEPQLLAGVESGNRAAAIAYRNMASDRGLSFHELPAALNFSDPSRTATYETATYTTSEGRTIAGSPIQYNATVPADAANPEHGRTFVRTLLESQNVLRDHGLTTPDTLPSTNGTPPEAIL